MASTKWKRRNMQRFKKVYPFVQRTPRYKFVSDKESILEVAEIRFNNDMTQQYIFQETYPTVPVVTAVSHDDVLGADASVSIMLKDLSKAAVTVVASQRFRGSVQLHIMWISET